MKMKAQVLLVIVVLALLGIIATAQDPTRDVKTPRGTITGYIDPDKKIGYNYRGIRYVKKYERWQHSVVNDEAFGAFDAQFDSPGCEQKCQLPPRTCPETLSETTCLTLNVFQPIDVSGDPRPVMVYFHGGNYYQGAISTKLYGGSTIADIGGVIVVTVNYRLGILGFYRDEDLGIYGNYGMIDQLNSLKWVKANIASFGGDPNNVTIFGQSAGSGSCAVHLISKYSEGLFHKAIMHSNPFAIPFRSLKTKSGLIKAFRKNSGCTTRDCLMNLTSQQIVDAQTLTATDLDAASGNMLSVFIPFNPYVESPGLEPADPQYPGLVPYQPQEAWLRGLVKNVPIMIGVVKQESDVFIYEAFDKDLDDVGYALFGWMIFGDEKNKRIQERYPPLKGQDNRDGLCTIGSEFIFACSTRNATRGAITTSVHQPLYHYTFDHLFQFNGDMWGPDFPVCSGALPSGKPPRVCHAGELPGLWNSAQWIFDYSEKDQALANQIDYFWTNFAWTGNPNSGPNARKLDSIWESYSGSGRTMYLSGDGNGMRNDPWEQQCNFWDSIGYFL